VSAPVDRDAIRHAMADPPGGVLRKLQRARHAALGNVGVPMVTLPCSVVEALATAAQSRADQQPASDEEIDAYLDAPLKDGGAGLKRRQFDDGLAHQINSGRHDARKAWRAAERRLGIAAPEPAKGAK